MNRDGSNEKIIKYVKILFELNVLKKLYDFALLNYQIVKNEEEKAES